MVLPIILYGNNILRKPCIDINKTFPELDTLINNLWSTLFSFGGLGLAAPQINCNWKVFIIDSSPVYDGQTDSQEQAVSKGDYGIKETFINARIIHKSNEKWSEPEGCLSIPGIVKPVERARSIIVEYLDMSFIRKRNQFSGYTAKIIQHEYDHTNGILFIDHLSVLKKYLLKNKLKKISSVL